MVSILVPYAFAYCFFTHACMTAEANVFQIGLLTHLMPRLMTVNGVKRKSNIPFVPSLRARPKTTSLPGVELKITKNPTRIDFYTERKGDREAWRDPELFSREHASYPPFYSSAERTRQTGR